MIMRKIVKHFFSIKISERLPCRRNVRRSIYFIGAIREAKTRNQRFPQPQPSLSPLFLMSQRDGG